MALTLIERMSALSNECQPYRTNVNLIRWISLLSDGHSNMSDRRTDGRIDNPNSGL
jgi:hypothetical protein